MNQIDHEVFCLLLYRLLFHLSNFQIFFNVTSKSNYLHEISKKRKSIEPMFSQQLLDQFIVRHGLDPLHDR